MAKVKLSDGESLYYEVHGSGPYLMLVSGLGGMASFWAPHVEALAKRFTVVLHDHRGTGQSSHSLIRYSVEQMADDVIQLMDRLDIARAHFIGHSTGGAIGQTLALDHPARMDRMVLSATWTVADAYFRRLFEVRSANLRTGGPEAYVRTNSLYMCPPIWIRDNMDAVEANEAKMLAAFPPPEVVLSRIEALMRFDRKAELGKIKSPVLISAVRDDIVTPAYYSEELAKLIPGAELSMLPFGGHFYPIVMAEAFRQSAIDFLTRSN
jgi:aminoacrylate hydrolase